jgi:hypothetical protein
MRRSGFGGSSETARWPACESDQTDGDASRAKGVTSNARTLTGVTCHIGGGPVEG